MAEHRSDSQDAAFRASCQEPQAADQRTSLRISLVCHTRQVIQVATHEWDELRELPHWLDKAAKRHERLQVEMPDGRVIVVMTAPDYESIEETLAVASDPELRDAIRRGLHDVERGDVVGLAEVRRMLDRPEA